MGYRRYLFVLWCEIGDKSSYYNLEVSTDEMTTEFIRDVEEAVANYRSYDRCCVTNVIKLDN